MKKGFLKLMIVAVSVMAACCQKPSDADFTVTGQIENVEEETNVIKEIIEAVKYCSRVKRGALIVIQKSEDKSLYNDVGTMVNADVSAELILTIFFPNTPLHDGALVVHKDKIVAAGVLLPLTKDPKLSWRYGTRHRAAIGASEISDSACIIVSEETGDISIAIDGILRKYDDIVTFKEDLEKLLTVENERNVENAFISNLLKLRKKQ
jgi:diadenylate cyclase